MPDIGPGHTRFVPLEDGSIVRRRWNDPTWSNRFATADDLKSASHVAELLRAAYVEGFNDRVDCIAMASTKVAR